MSSFEFVLVCLGSYLYCGWSAVFSRGGGGHGGGGLDKGGGHLRGRAVVLAEPAEGTSPTRRTLPLILMLGLP